MSVSERTVFWPSMAGSCSLEIAAWLKDREATAPDPSVIPFLRDGTHLQTGVEKFLREFCHEERYRFPYPFSPLRKEPGGKYKPVDRPYQFNARVDGIFKEEGALLEVKCVKERQYNKLVKAKDWRTVYPNYPYTAQVYLAIDEYRLPDSDTDTYITYAGPFTKVYYIFKNRNTSEMLGGINFEHPAYIYRKDMVERVNEDLLSEILEKHDQLTIGKCKNLKCDVASSYCYFCGKPKFTKVKPSKPNTQGWVNGRWKGKLK